jgi:hypothetical protein
MQRAESSPGSRRSVDFADDLLERLNQALEGANAAEQSDHSLSESCATPPSLSNPPSLSTTPFVRPTGAGAGGAGEAAAEADESERTDTQASGARGSQRSRPDSVQAKARLSPATGDDAGGGTRRRPHSAGASGIRAWGDGDDDADTASCRDAEDEEEPGERMRISLEICEARHLPQAMARSTGECYVELRRRTQRGMFARLNPAQSRVRSVKTTRVKRAWGADDKSSRVARWKAGQCIDVEASPSDSLILNLWDYKTIGSCLKVGYARLDCADIPVGGDTETFTLPVCDRAGQPVAGSNGQATAVVMSAAAVPTQCEQPVRKEWSEEATTAAAASADRSPPPKPATAGAARPPANNTPTPVLDAMMLKLGAHCEHGGEALVFLGLDGDGRVSARQVSLALELDPSAPNAPHGIPPWTRTVLTGSVCPICGPGAGNCLRKGGHYR